jgi:hypothetical protein
LEDQVLYPEITIGPIKKGELNVNVQMWLEASQPDILCNRLNQNIPIFFPTWLRVGGWQYFSNSIIVIKKVLRPTLVFRNLEFFKNYSTITFDCQYHAYVVEKVPNKNKILSLNMCMSVEPLDI